MWEEGLGKAAWKFARLEARSPDPGDGDLEVYQLGPNKAALGWEVRGAEFSTWGGGPKLARSPVF